MPDPVTEFARLAVGQIEQIAAANVEQIAAAADIVVEVGRSGHVLFAGGAGHSLGGVLELFFRAGGLAYVSPLWHPRILPLNGASQSTAAERETGIGTQVAAASDMGPGDALVVFSNSGINPYPVELAEHARSVGTTVIAVTSVAASKEAPLRGPKRLFEAADLVLDTLIPPGDVSWPVDAPQVAPLSSLANVVVWNMVMVSALQRDPDLPTWRSANVGGPETSNEALAARYGARIALM